MRHERYGRRSEPGRIGAPSEAPSGEAAAHPLWPMVAILGDIAARVERRRAEEGAPPRDEGAAGGEPAAREEAA